jgi:hypothetical protein
LGGQPECLSSHILKRVWKVRKEVQEYPNNPLKEAFMDKLKDVHKEEERVDGLNI